MYVSLVHLVLLFVLHIHMIRICHQHTLPEKLNMTYCNTFFGGFYKNIVALLLYIGDRTDIPLFIYKTSYLVENNFVLGTCW